MYTLKPYFYDDFHCIGSECLYTCCGGWLINIEEKIAKEYKQYRGSLKKIVEDYLVYNKEKDTYAIQLDEKGMCPFCNGEQLCRLIKEQGEQFLSTTCRMFPRTELMTKETKEYYLSLGCPTVVSFLKGRREPLSFILEDGEKEEDELKDAAGEGRKEIELLYEFIEMDMEIRDCMVDLLQNREWPLWFREFLVAYCLDKIKEEHHQGRIEEVYLILKRTLEPYFVRTFMEKMTSLPKDKERQFMALRQITNHLSDMIMGILHLGKGGKCAAKATELLNRNLNISFEEYETAYGNWRKRAEEEHEILAEHIAAYNWMQYAMTAFTTYYMVDNYWDVILGQILIKYFCVLQYSIYDKIEWTDIEMIVSLVCRGIHHGRETMKGKLVELKKQNWLSVSGLFVLISP